MRFSRFGILVGLAVVATVAASAGPPGMGRGPHAGPGGGPFEPAMGAAGHALRRLDLSVDQRRQVREVVERRMEGELGESLRSFMDARRALEAAVWDPEASAADVRAASDLVAEKAQAIVEQRHALALEVLAGLTDEQRDAFRALLTAGPPRRPGPPPWGR